MGWLWMGGRLSAKVADPRGRGLSRFLHAGKRVFLSVDGDHFLDFGKRM